MDSESEWYRKASGRARRLPTWWLRRREQKIIARRPRPARAELAELRAIRAELRHRTKCRGASC